MTENTRAKPRVSPRNRIFIAVIAIVIALAVVAFVVALATALLWKPHDGSINTTSHPDPAATAKEYLEAIATGDAATAREIDRTAFEEYPLFGTNTELLSDEVLDGAVERISAIRVKQTTATEENADVLTSFTLGGKRYVQNLNLVWSDKLDGWQAEQSFAVPITAGSDTGELNGAEFVPFRLGSGPVVVQDTEARTTLGVSVYPAIYTFTADIDPDTIVDLAADPLQRELVAVPDNDLYPAITYEVTG